MIIKIREPQTRRNVSDLNLPDYRDARNNDMPRNGVNGKSPGSEIKLSDALKEIERIKHDLPQLRKSEFDEGFREGHVEGMAEASKHVQETIQKLVQVMETVQNSQAELLKQAEDFAVRLALGIVEKIAGESQFQALKIDETKLTALMRDALNSFSDAGKYVIRLHPDSCSALSKAEPAIAEELGEKITLVFRPDPSLKPCECLIESDYGVIDTRIEAQLDEFSKLLHGNAQ